MNIKALFFDQCSTTDIFLKDVINGLSQQKKTLPSKYFYNEIGSYYFECICRSEDYYLTRTELSIMDQYKKQIAQRVGPRCLLLEYGSGSSTKTKFLLDNLICPCAYIPIDICPEYLDKTQSVFNDVYPGLETLPVHADFTKPFTVPEPGSPYNRKMIYFPGSTIGNFTPSQATSLLKQMRSLCSSQDIVLLGVDLKKDKSILDQAYNDRDGFTAAFNLNLLQRINHDLLANFTVEDFQHHAFYNEEKGRIEMHLKSTCPQMVDIGNRSFFFNEEETIQTELSYKYDFAALNQLARSANFRIDQIWTDTNEFFAVALLVVDVNLFDRFPKFTLGSR